MPKAALPAGSPAGTQLRCTEPFGLSFTIALARVEGRGDSPGFSTQSHWQATK